MKLLTVVGARPQFVKAAAFSAVFRKQHKEVLVHTGQHYDTNMSDVFFDELGIPKPDYNLGVGSLSHGAQTGRMLERIEELLLLENPDGMLVYGDTNSTLAGALAASKLHVPVFHVEAGLRSYNMLMPEEQNRVLADHISTKLFCPTKTAVDNLKKEGITKGVVNTGDIMYDAALANIVKSKQRYSDGSWTAELKTNDEIVPKILEKEYYLATVHRAENTDDKNKLSEIFTAFNNLDEPVLLPLHPRTQKLVKELNLSMHNIVIVHPVGYLLMLYLIANAFMVITDSGGLQKEAYFLKTPCTTLRDQTEWVETLENGWNILVPIVQEEIIKCAARPQEFLESEQPLAFGDGCASKHIFAALLNGGNTKWGI